MKLRCIIIEDEPLATEKLENFVSKTPSLKLVESFDNAMDGMHFLQNNKVDLLFLDIQMEHLTGIEMLESLSVKPYVVITTAYAEYALKGYELCVFDYLLKPFGFERFLQAVNKVLDDFSKKQVSSKETPPHIFVKTEYRLENILVDEILYVEGMKEYLRIVLPDRKIMTKMSFKDLLEKLPEERFIQVHKSWVVHIPKIETIERQRIKIGEVLIPIGESYKSWFFQVLGQ